MLENNMEVAEKPERLVIYGGIGKCARNWESYHAIVDSLLELEDDETLAIQSGMPVAIFKTHRLAPRVVMANTNIMKATWPVFYDLQDKNLTMFAQYTAAPWEYIGTQGVIQGTFETLAAIAEQHFAGSLVGRVLFTAGHGRHGRQPDPCDGDAGRRVRRRRRRPSGHRAADRTRILRRPGAVAGRGDRHGRARAGRGQAAGHRAGRQRRRGVPGRAGPWMATGHRDRDVPVPRPVLLHPGRAHPAAGRRAAPDRP